MNTRGNALNGAAIALDTVGGFALAGGALWLVLDWKRSRDRGLGSAGKGWRGGSGLCGMAAHGLLKPSRGGSIVPSLLFSLRFSRCDQFREKGIAVLDWRFSPRWLIWAGRLWHMVQRRAFGPAMTSRAERGEWTTSGP